MKKCICIVMAIILTSCLLASCDSNSGHTPTPETQQPPVSTAPPATTSAGLTVELSGLWGKIDGSTATIPLTAALHDRLGSGGSPPVHQTTSEAYQNLISGRADLIFVTHPSEDEFETARQDGVELEVIPVVKDALVFLVNIENPVSNVTLSQLRDIYTGRITNWNALGGPDESIIPYQRTPNSGSQTLLLKLVMDGQTPMDPPAEWIAAEMGWLVEVVSEYDNTREAIGYSMFYYVNNMYGNSRFKLLGIDGVKPSRDTIARGEYPLEDHYYAVIRKDTPAGSPARALIDWLLTDEGQELAVRAGYIPLRSMDGILPDDAIDPVYLGDADNSSGTGGTVHKGWEASGELVSRGVRKPLSDVFYDGFNYIAYINSEILREIMTAKVSEFTAPFLSLPWEERGSKRPFSGIPNDYPNYELGDYAGQLHIHFPAENPFFTTSKEFLIRLTEEISPYGTGLGGLTETYHRAGQLMTNLDLFTIRVKIPDAPDAAKRINAHLTAWTNRFPGEHRELLEGFVRWYGSQPEYPYRLQPMTGRWKNYLSVTYILQTYDGPSTHMPMLYTICFDITTGDVVNLADALPRELPFAEAMVFFPASGFEGRYSEGGNVLRQSDDYFESYEPPGGTVIDEAWLLGNMLGLHLTEPSGRKLQVFFYGEWS